MYKRQSSGQSCDPAIVHEEAKGSGVHTNHVTLHLATDNAWEDTRTRTSIKSALMGFFVKIRTTEASEESETLKDRQTEVLWKLDKSNCSLSVARFVFVFNVR